MIRWKGTDYRVIEPELIDTKAARAEIRTAFNLSDRAFLRLMGITQVMRLRIAPPGLAVDSPFGDAPRSVA